MISSIWASNYPTRFTNLNILQRKALRIILGFSRTCRWHSSDLFSKTGVLTIAQINLCQTNEFMYKYTNNMLPQGFPNQFQQISSINPYNIHSAANYRPDFCCTNVRQFCIRYSGPSTWNDTPNSIRSITTLHGFIKNFRKFLQGFNLTPEAH